MKGIYDSAVHAIKKFLCSKNNRLNNLILITCIRSNLRLPYQDLWYKNIYFRSENKNRIDLIDAEILDLTIRSTIEIKIS